MSTKVPMYHCTQPCSNCPYRTDAPKKLWHKVEFETLLSHENNPMGAVYSCHKANGSVCVGWLMDQDKNNLPSIALRISLSKHKVTRKYLDSLHSPAKLYSTVKQMIKANFPSILKRK